MIGSDFSSRRHWLQGTSALAMGLALQSLGPRRSRGADQPNEGGELGIVAAHVPARAKQCIFLTMEGGPSHIDTFDPKPKLDELHLQEFQRGGEQRSAMESGKRYYVRSPFRFRRAGACGADIAENWTHLSEQVDRICFYRGCQVDSVNHPTAMYQLNTGNRFGGDPAVGAWTLYGLGSLNENVPAFVVIPDASLPQGGASNWGNGFLPPKFQGTTLRSSGSPILDLEPRSEITSQHQQANLELLRSFNERHASTRANHDELQARIDAYELAFRMQAEVPQLLDLNQETQTTRTAYGIDQEPTDRFGRKCLLARRMIEQGVRFVQLYAGTWDSHDYIERAHGHLVRSVDRPIAALLSDLADRGLLDTTLVVWCGEFGRSPDNGVRGGTAYGRDHNPRAMTIWLAGGGSAAGTTVGATDETGAEAVECVHHVRDLHVTLLRLLGLDDRKLTFFHGGRHKQLSQFGGEVIPELLG
ncbi:MAG: DUF1501 domain-containing protein [Planctomycetales bacterium]|nr:DUF1501 domain-containing protein [Planctomycetales bacterium]